MRWFNVNTDGFWQVYKTYCPSQVAWMVSSFCFNRFQLISTVSGLSGFAVQMDLSAVPNILKASKNPYWVKEGQGFLKPLPSWCSLGCAKTGFWDIITAEKANVAANRRNMKKKESKKGQEKDIFRWRSLCHPTRFFLCTKNEKDEELIHVFQNLMFKIWMLFFSDGVH